MDDTRCTECKRCVAVYLTRVTEVLNLTDIVKDEQSTSHAFHVAKNYLKLAMEECEKFATTVCVCGGVAFIMQVGRCAEILAAA